MGRGFFFFFFFSDHVFRFFSSGSSESFMVVECFFRKPFFPLCSSPPGVSVFFLVSQAHHHGFGFLSLNVLFVYMLVFVFYIFSPFREWWRVITYIYLTRQKGIAGVGKGNKILDKMLNIKTEL